MNQPTRTSKDNTNRTRTVEGAGGAFANRSMPESLAAEAAVLGSMIIDPECIGEVVEQLGTDGLEPLESPCGHD